MWKLTIKRNMDYIAKRTEGCQGALSVGNINLATFVFNTICNESKPSFPLQNPSV